MRIQYPLLSYFACSIACAEPAVARLVSSKSSITDKKTPSNVHNNAPLVNNNSIILLYTHTLCTH